MHSISDFTGPTKTPAAAINMQATPTIHAALRGKTRLKTRPDRGRCDPDRAFEARPAAVIAGSMSSPGRFGSSTTDEYDDAAKGLVSLSANNRRSRPETEVV